MRYSVFFLVHNGSNLPIKVKSMRMAKEIEKMLKDKGAPVVLIERIHQDKIDKQKKARFWL